jgi:hypothetical protein
MSDAIPPIIGQPNHVGPFLFIEGGFAIGASRVPYFSASLPVETAARVIRMPSEMPVSAERPLDLSELIQRDLIEERVDEGLNAYLRDPSSAHFFNSLTVALLPMSSDSNGLALADSYAEQVGPQHLVPEYGDDVIGPVTLMRPANHGGHGFLAWDSKFTFPVVLDGQHRLAALKAAMSGNFPRKLDLENSRVSILFLVLDERAGYLAPAYPSVLAACRSIFIDLNKNAKSIAKGRQYLLDDRDLSSGCLRSVLHDSVSVTDLGPVSSRVNVEPRLPLSLVDWRSESAKFDGDSPFVTSLLALYAIVDAIAGIKTPDFSDIEAVKLFLDRSTARLLEPSAAADFMKSVSERLKHCEEQDVPFTLYGDEVNVLASGFRARFGRRIVSLMTELKPYRDLIEGYESAGLIGTAKEAWFSLDDPGRRALVESLQIGDPAQEIAEIVSTVKGVDLAYQVVFQRAAVLALNHVLDFPDVAGSLWNLGATASEADVTLEFIKRWNERLAPSTKKGASKASPFVGAGVRIEGTIDFRKTRVSAIEGFIVYAVLSPEEWWLQENPVPTPDSLREWVSKGFEQIGPGAPGNPEKALLGQAGSKWRRGLADVADLLPVVGGLDNSIASCAAGRMHLLVQISRNALAP